MTSRSADVGDIQVRYLESGAGVPVVLVHGIGQDSSSWRVQLDTLDGVLGYAADVRGHGDTTLGAANGTLAQLSGDLCDFLDSVSGPASCVGFSMGGTIVLAAAAARPDLVRSLVLMGTSSVVGRAAAAFYERRAAESSDRAALAAGVHEDTAAGLFRAHDLDALVEGRLRAIGDGRGFANACRAMARVAAEPLTPLLARVEAPATVIGAQHDTMCPRKAADILLAGLPDARYVEIADASHLMNVDRPDAVTVAIRDAVAG
ncbi:MAG: alpha/beta fold hydrolase [Jatrophihabitantaceae bacterium]